MSDGRNIEKQFGFFDTYEELNKAAAGLLEEGDLKGLRSLAKENGIPKAMVDAYERGDAATRLCDAQTAAIGALEAELENLKGQKNALGQLVVDYLSGRCGKEDTAEKIRKNAGKLSGFVDKTFAEAKGRAGGNSTFWLKDDEIKAEARKYFIRGREPWKKQK